MKPVEYIVVERIVCQRCVSEYKREADYLAAEQLTNLLENSKKTWNDIEMVYQFCEVRRVVAKRKRVEQIGLYLQGKPGKTDYMYMAGLDFLVPVRDVLAEAVAFMKGGWNK